jgi:hypothetical protein
MEASAATPTITVGRCCVKVSGTSRPDGLADADRSEAAIRFFVMQRDV